jgi:transportin-1
MGADDDSDDEDDDAADALSEWSLRKSAAASLDVLSGVYGDEFTKNQLHQGIAVQGSGNFLEILLPFLNQMLGSAEWEHRESGILALGAIAEGCIEGLSPHLPQLIPFLIGALSSEKALIRSITCWTLSRYASWVLMFAEPAGGPGAELLPALLEQLLKRVLDGNKRVQEAACSALAVLEEEANMNGAALLPYLGPILQTLVAAHGTYQEKNMMILYDAIQTLADAVGPALNEEQYIQLLMPSLMDKWRALEGPDPNLFPLLECLTSVALALGHGFYPYCEEVHQRCVYLVHSDMQAEAAHRADPANNPEPEKDFVIVALDLLSSITEGVGVAIESLVKNTDILPLLLHYARDYTPEVRQSTFALIGDYAKTCFVHLKPFILIIGEDGQIGGLLPVLASNLDATHVPVCNNATWAIGEIAMQLGDEMRQFLPQILPPLIALMNNPDNHQPILENTGITLGRMGLVCPAEIAAVLPEFVILWCKYMRGFKNNEEKYDAFRGICKVIMTNPQCIAESLPFFCTAILSWDENSLVTKFPDLPELFRQILQYFKNSVGPQQWQGYFAQFPAKIQPPLQRLYGL